MDLQGIPKRAWRARIIESYRYLTDNRTIPNNQYIFSLGADATLPGSEYEYLVRERKFLKPWQYVSVERDKHIHRRNLSIDGPLFLQGNLKHVFPRIFNSAKNGYECAIVSADLMCGVDAAMSTLISVLDTVKESCGTIVIFNVLETNKWRARMGRHFSSVLPTVNDNYILKK